MFIPRSMKDDKSARITKIDFLKHWNYKREEAEVKIDDLPKLDENILYGGLDLAERIDHSCLFALNWDGQHLDQKGVAEWGDRGTKIRYPEIAEDVAGINEKLNFHKIGYDETGNIAVGYLFTKRYTGTSGLDGIMEPIHVTNPIKLDCIRVVNYLKDLGILRVKPNDPVIRQMEEQQKVISSAGVQRYEHPSGVHDDRFWALAFACYIAVEAIVGLPPIALETYDQAIDMGEDPDEIIDNIMKQHSHQFGGYSWG